jgi:hypothetical protein
MKKIFILSFSLIFINCSTDSDSITKGDGTGGSLAIFALKGNYLYTVDDSSLNVFSLIETNDPVKVNDLFVGFAIETLYINGENLYMGSQNGMYIYSLENPENPQFLSNAQHITACDPVVANNTHAFVTLHSSNFCGNNTNLLQVYETSSLTDPILIHQRNLTFPRGLGLYNDYLLVCDDVIKIFSIQNPAEPIVVGTIPLNCFDVIIKGNDLYAIGQNGLFLYELNPQNIENYTLKSSISF